jgi:hypothetical protein
MCNNLGLKLTTYYKAENFTYCKAFVLTSATPKVSRLLYARLNNSCGLE